MQPLALRPSVVTAAATGGQTEGLQDARKTTSEFRGVSWERGRYAWAVKLRNSLTKRTQHIGLYTSEEDVARAYDWAAVKLRGPDTKRNFPNEIISEPPASRGDERKECKTSRYVGVSWHKASTCWRVELWDPQTQRKQHIGSYASEEDAARVYDYAAVQMHGPKFKGRCFPTELISEPPVSLGDKRKERKSTRIISDKIE
ncbi:hypothetical protein FOA52_004632 [Chlamydomonas sp. UWO 241]|nr:hypothetical protein FOA52_004632 [Chlamydomonas sp. UWO 241]